MIKLINGDCHKEIKKIKNESVHLILTDPPYELGSFRGEIGVWEGSEICSSDVFKDCLDVLILGSHMLCFSSNRTMYKFGTAMESCGFELRDTLIWEYLNQSIPRNMNLSKAIDAHMLYGKTSSKYLKMVEQEYGGEAYVISGTNNTMFGEKKYFERKEYSPITEQAKEWVGWGTNLAPNFEPIIMCRKKFNNSLASNILSGGRGAINISEISEINGKFPSNILKFKKETKDTFNTHPMVKPVELLEYIILMTTKEGDTVLDPFMGSGSCAVACANTKRNFIGIEVNKKYFDIAEKRIINLQSQSIT